MSDVEREFDEVFKEFKSGAKRSAEAPRYDLIPWAGLRRLALRYGMGAKKYGEFNWQKGLEDKEFVNQFKAHLIEHVWAFLRDGCTLDDNLAAIAWGAFALMEVEERHGHHAVYSQRDIEGNGKGGSDTQTSPDPRSRTVRGNPVRGGGRGDERGFGLVTTGIASPSSNKLTDITVDLSNVSRHRKLSERTSKRGGRAGRGNGNRMVAGKDRR